MRAEKLMKENSIRGNLFAVIASVSALSILVLLAPFEWNSKLEMPIGYYRAFQVVFVIVAIVLLTFALRACSDSSWVRSLILGAVMGYVAGLVAYFGALGISQGAMSSVATDWHTSPMAFMIVAAWVPLIMLCWLFGAAALIGALLLRPRI